MRVHRAYVDAWDFHALLPWIPFTDEVRATLRMLAEQSDGLEISLAYQTASYRFDQAASLDDWQVIGNIITNEGDAAPQDITPSGAGSKFWIRLGVAIRKPSGASGIGVASIGVQWSLSTERSTLLVSPNVVNAYDNPVSSVEVELVTTEWMPFYKLQEVTVAFESFDAEQDFRYSVALQSVQSDPSQQEPAEDTILSAQTGDTAGLATHTTFSNATASKAQLCRVVLKADNNGTATDKRGRVYLAVSNRYE